MFGYVANDKPVSEMGEPERVANVEALAQALLWTMVVPWIPCFIFYTLMHWTYKADKASYQAEFAALTEGGGEGEGRSRDNGIAMTVRERVPGGKEEETAALLSSRDST